VVVHAADGPALLFRPGQRRQEQGGEDSDDGNYNQQFNQGETAALCSLVTGHIFSAVVHDNNSQPRVNPLVLLAHCPRGYHNLTLPAPLADAAI
jgi:hypothetical protein